MSLAMIAYAQAHLLFVGVGDASVTQFDVVEWLVTSAWQWLTLASVVIWLGTLLAERRILALCKRERRAEVLAILRFARQRQRRQTWLWLSIILVGTLALFWLRLSHALPHQELNTLPDWPVLSSFLLTTTEGWLWLARGALALLGGTLLTALSISAWRRARALSSSLAAEARIYDVFIAVAAAMLFTFVLTDSGMWKGQLSFGILALAFVALLALAAWLGRTIYAAFVLAPACHAIESDERTQALLELFEAIRPALAQTMIALALYGICFVEAHITGMRLSSIDSVLSLLQRPVSWVLLAEICLLAGMAFLASYQSRRVLPHLARMAWLAARGTVAPMLSGMDVSRSLQISQDERQKFAALAERRLLKTLTAQAAFSLLLLLCLVMASLISWQIVS